MKTALDSRHQDRSERVKALFAYAFDHSQTIGIEPIVEKLDQIDQYIKQAAKERPLQQVNPVDLAIIREAIYEIVFENQEGKNNSIIIDEAIEIGKTYGADSSPKFIHAVIDKIVKEIL